MKSDDIIREAFHQVKAKPPMRLRQAKWDEEDPKKVEAMRRGIALSLARQNGAKLKK